MKKFVLAFGIPVLAVASLIGSGYATWYFNSDVVTAKEGITVEPTEKRVVGAKFQKIELFGATKLVLDQTEKKDGMPTGRNGVHFEGGFSEHLVADDGDDKTTDDTFVAGTSYKVTTTITIPSEVATYVNFTFDGNTSSTTSLTLTKEHTYTVEGEAQNAFEVFKISDVTSATSDVTVEYANEPSTSTAYDDMALAVNGKSITISFAAEIVK